MKKTFEGNLNMCENGKECASLAERLGPRVQGRFDKLFPSNPLVATILKASGKPSIERIIKRLAYDFFAAGVLVEREGSEKLPDVLAHLDKLAEIAKILKSLEAKDPEAAPPAPMPDTMQEFIKGILQSSEYSNTSDVQEVERDALGDLEIPTKPGEVLSEVHVYDPVHDKHHHIKGLAGLSAEQVRERVKAALAGH